MRQELKGEITFINRKKQIGMIHGEDKKVYYFRKGDYKDDLEEQEKVVFTERNGLIQTSNTLYFAENIRKYQGE